MQIWCFEPWDRTFILRSENHKKFEGGTKLHKIANGVNKFIYDLHALLRLITR